jgi:hypothetical protein
MSNKIGALLVTLSEPVDEERAGQLAGAIGMMREVLEVSRVTDGYQDEMNRERIRHEFYNAIVRVLLDRDFRARNAIEVGQATARPFRESGWRR